MNQDNHEYKNYKWNYTLWIVETSAWMLATAFIDSTTVLPVLLLTLSGSSFLAGSVLSLRYAGQGWPQLSAASYVSGKPTRKWFYLISVIPGRVLLLWPAVLMMTGVTDPARTVPAVMIAYFGFWISEGFSIVPWVDMLGKTIPPTRRGRLFGLMHVVGGILGIFAGLIIREILQRSFFPYPVGYGVLFLFAFIAVTVSTISLSLLREPHSPPQEERYSTLALIKDIPNLLRSMPTFRLLIILQGLFAFALLPAPFYILYVSELLGRNSAGAGAAGVGVFLAIQTAGMIAGNALLGHIGDRYGNRLLLRVVSFIHACVPAVAIGAGMLVSAQMPSWAIYMIFAPTFFGFGALQGATWMGMTNYLLEIAPIHDRPAYIAVMNALNIPAVILPLCGGLLLTYIGYTPLFYIATLFLLLAFLLSGRLHEPRESHVHHLTHDEKGAG